jgi:hypothetical protein
MSENLLNSAVSYIGTFYSQFEPGFVSVFGMGMGALGAYYVGSVISVASEFIKRWITNLRLKEQQIQEIDANQSILSLWRVHLDQNSDRILRENLKVYPINLIRAISDHITKEGRLFEVLDKETVIRLFTTYQRIDEKSQILVNELNNGSHPKNLTPFLQYLKERISEFNQLDQNLLSLEQDLRRTAR